MTRKERAETFLKLVSAGNVQEGYDRFVHPDFKHHNIYFKGDRESFRKAMEENARQFPDKTFEVLRSLEDGDLVAVHGRVRLGDKVYALIHIFRFRGDKIIEAWEASQEEVRESPNDNGLF